VVVELLWKGIAIRDFPRGSGSLITAGIRGRDPGSRDSAFRGSRIQRNRSRRNRDFVKRDGPTVTIPVEDRCREVSPVGRRRQVASAYRELGGSRVGATKICVKVCEVARGDISATID
jgi:hypothetical protein